MDERKPAFWAVIPANVLFSQDLRPNAKLLFGVVTLLQEASGYCYASNRYLASLFGLQPDTITGLLGNLEDAGLIATDVVRDEVTNEVRQRRIWTVAQIPVVHDPLPEKNRGGVPEKNRGASPKNLGEPPRKKSEYINTSNNNTSNNIPPIVPHAGDGCAHGDKRTPSLPKWKPERFQKFWEFYPRGENRQRAVKAWDKLKPDDETIDAMARALVWQKGCADWQRGIGIPYAATWINQRRWEDEITKIPVVDANPCRVWDDDPEVLD